MARHASIRRRITVLATALVSAVLVLAAVAVTTVQRSQLLGNLDSSLEQRADDLVTFLDQSDIVAPLSTAFEVDRFTQVVGPDGEVVASSANVASMRPALVAAGQTQRVETVSNLPVEDDDFRVLVRGLPDGQSIIVAENIDDVTDATRALAWTLGATIAALSLLLAALVWWLVGRTLRPVDAIRAEVSAITGDQLARRVSVPPGDDEIGQLAQTMNEMLDRVEDSSVRQQRFVADASHELRSPLTRLRTSLEVELAREDRDLETTAQEALEEAIGLQHLIDDLLHLARADAGERTAVFGPVDLDDIVLDQARRLRERADIEVDSTAVSAGPVWGEASQLGRAVRNLCDNARWHANHQVTLGLAESNGRVRFSIDDDGPGVPDAMLETIFGRFTRVDEARSAHQGGTGLGLAIVQDVARAHGGEVSARRSRLGGLCVVLDLPAAH